MKNLKLYLIASCLLVALNSLAQKTPENPNVPASEKLSVSFGAGIANYYGDLMKKSGFFSQTSYSFSAGAKYAFTNKLAARLDFGLQKVQGSDSKPGGAHPSRNLSFKSNVVDFSISGEYTILNLDNFPLSPYVSAGVGVMFFNPYTEDNLGNRQRLAELGTEGQGLPGYSDFYSTAALEFPLGIGVKYPINERMGVCLDFNYRITKTDYLDDVSTNRYPDKAILDARNPITSKFTWRGDAVGSGAYPKNSTLPRGNPDNNDGFFTTQVKFTFKL
jgi:opacity protein-like surface antigen